MSNNKIRKTALGDQHGIFQHFQSDVTDYPSREKYLSVRGGEPTSRDQLYGITSEKEASYVPTEFVAPHLSTRYSPDRVGVQAMRVPGSNGGIFQDPYTKKIYDYNEGFTTETGRNFPPGSAALQTSLMSFAEKLGETGLTKEAAYVKGLVRSEAAQGHETNAANITNDIAVIATHLDSIGLYTEANYLDQVLKKRAGRLRSWEDRLGFNTDMR